MPVMYEIAYLPEGRLADFAGSRGNYYEFEDGSHVDLQSTPVWCHRCGKVTHGESIKPLVEIAAMLSELLDPDSERSQEIMSPYLPDRAEVGAKVRLDRIDSTKKRRLWRERRQSAPKCIMCGSTDLFEFEMGQPIPNPAGHGTIEVRVTGLCSTQFNQWFFTTEGDRIPRDTKPTYWHHPGVKDQRWMLKKLLPDLFGDKPCDQ